MLHLQDFTRSFLLLVASLGVVSASASAVLAEEPLEAFFTKHCLRCHGPEKEKEKEEKGDLRIDRLS